MKTHTSLLILAVGILLLAVWAGSSLDRTAPYLGVELLGTGNVHAIDVPGPGSEAGLAIGDQILAVEGRPFLHALSLTAGREPGERIILTVRSAGEISQVPLVLGTISRREYIFAIEKLIVGLIFTLVSTTILMLRPSDLSVRLFFLFSQLMAALNFGEILDPVVPSMSALTSLGRFLLAPLVLHFFVTFPRPLPGRLRRLLLTGAYGSALVLALLDVAALAVSLDLYAWNVWLLPRAYEIAITLIALGVLFRPQRSAPLVVRRRRRVLIAGMLLGFTPVLLTLGSMFVAGGEPIIPYEWTLPALALVPLVYGYAVYREELQQADLILNRSMVYFLLSALLLGLYGMLFFGLDAALSSERGLEHLLAGAVLVAAGSALFVPMRVRLQRWVDRFFYGGWYDYRSFVQSVSAQLSRSVDLEQFLDQLRTAAQTMRFQAGAILWPKADKLAPLGGYGLSRTSLLRLHLARESPILWRLQEEARPLSRNELAGLLEDVQLSEHERELLEMPEIEFWLPLVCHGELQSVLLTGQRQGDEALDKEDLAILSTLATQAAMACENIALLESLRERLAEVEQVRDELAETQSRLAEGREEERLHLARELHDGPVQDLYAMVHEIELSTDAMAGPTDSLRETAQRVARTLRDICVELRPPLLADFGLDVAIRSLAARIQEKHPDVNLRLDVVPHSEDLPERTQLALFRICQEALNNALQHGHASNMRIRFEADAEQIILQVEDDGRGFEVPDRWIEFGRRGHLGLLGISERTEAVGGQLEVRSARGRGTRLRVVVPTPDPFGSKGNGAVRDIRSRHAAAAQPPAEARRNAP